ncbi:site-specific DNA-methyltransferase [candidate division KSB1 bacterium]|nr:site-specific DNA-methyltransferase [candidate division KSB1 bacterium]
MVENIKTVAEKRNYSVLNVKSAKKVALLWLEQVRLENAVNFGLPEVDDRYHYWRVPLIGKNDEGELGEIVIDARTSLIIQDKSTNASTLEARLLGRNGTESRITNAKSNGKYELSSMRNVIALGDSEEILQDLPANSVNLVFTSPPYFNARPEYNDYIDYEEYLLKIRKIIRQAHRVLSDGRFFVMNVSPILIRRSNRNKSSKRIAVPFDMHRLFIEEDYDFIDDIIWEKPEGAGWATGRGRRFAADRNPLQYKPVPVTEYILVYRKRTDKLIDWNIRAHPKPELVKKSKIADDYEKTNIWRITPTYDKRHPAIFPLELAEKVISYYSFKEDIVLDPFAGIGTTGKAAIKSGRRFVLVEKEKKYLNIIKDEAKSWLGKNATDILTINCSPINVDDILL